MNEIDGLKSGLQSLSADVQALSNSVKSASQSMQNTSAGVVNGIQRVGAGVQGAYARMAYPVMQPPVQGFTGAPTSYRGNLMAPLATPRRESMIMNLYGGTLNNEYNKPTNWFRDILALSGKEFVDVQSQEAKEYASRNWGHRAKAGAWEALGLGIWSLPVVGFPLGAAYETIAKPLLQEKDKREQAYFNFIDRTGARNVDARLSITGEGGYSMVQADALSKVAANAHKGTGFKKSQWDELVQYAEQAGYFKTYDKATIDSAARKYEQLAKDAKYAMQTLHVTAEDAAKILGGINKLSGSTAAGSTAQINLLNKAAAYTGLSPMQMDEYAMGRMERYKSYGYSESAGYATSLREMVDIIRNTPQGQKPNPERVLGTRDAISDMWRKNPVAQQLMGAFFKVGDNGQLEFDSKARDKFFTGKGTVQDLVNESASNMQGYSTDQMGMVGRGGLMKLFEGKSGMSPDDMEKFSAAMAMRFLIPLQHKSLQDRMMASGGKLTDELLAEYSGTLESYGINMSMEDVRKLWEQGGLNDPETLKKYKLSKEENLSHGETGYIGPGAKSLSHGETGYIRPGAKKFMRIADRKEKEGYSDEVKRWGKSPIPGQDWKESRAFTIGIVKRLGDVSRLKEKHTDKLDELISDSDGSEATLYREFAKLAKNGQVNQAKYLAEHVKDKYGLDLYYPMEKTRKLTGMEMLDRAAFGVLANVGVKMKDVDKGELKATKDTMAKIWGRRRDYLDGGGSYSGWYDSEGYLDSIKDLKTLGKNMQIPSRKVEDFATNMMSELHISKNAAGSFVTSYGQNVSSMVNEAVDSLNATNGTVEKIVEDSKTQADLNTNFAEYVESQTKVNEAMLLKLQELR